MPTLPPPPARPRPSRRPGSEPAAPRPSSRAGGAPPASAPSRAGSRTARRPSSHGKPAASTPAARILAIGLGFMALYLALALRLFFLQIVRHREFVETARRLRQKEVYLPARRGDLIDRNGMLLVRNEPASDIVLDPRQWEVHLNPKTGETIELRRERVIAGLAPYLPGVDVAALLAKDEAHPDKEGHLRTITLAQRIDVLTGEKIRKADLMGVGVLPSFRRVAVDGSLAPHVLGFTGRDGAGLDGLEHGLNTSLSGKVGVMSAEFAHHEPIPGTEQTKQPLQNGRDIVLTIDSTLQHYVQVALGTAFAKHQAEAATAIVLDPKTGDILACANYPSFNVNDRGAMPADVRADRAVTSPYEPGSTLKIVTVAAALEEKKVTPDTRFDCNGSLAIGKKFVHCHLDNAFPHGHGDENLTEVIKNSCNVATAKCAFLLGKAKLYQYETAFGFGQKTGSGLPGEARGIMKSYDKWSDMQLANIAFGQGISVTPLQLAAAYATIANDGVYHRPHIVWGDRNEVTQALEPDKPEDGRRVISAGTAQQLKAMLKEVVDHGTGKNAQLEGYTAGGKTGTAQIAKHGSYANGTFVASFIGMAPMSDPQYVILVAITDPKDAHFGAEVSAPVFKQIAEQALLSHRVPQDKAPSETGAKGKGPKVPLRDD